MELQSSFPLHSNFLFVESAEKRLKCSRDYFNFCVNRHIAVSSSGCFPIGTKIARSVEQNTDTESERITSESLVKTMNDTTFISTP